MPLLYVSAVPSDIEVQVEGKGGGEVLCLRAGDVAVYVVPQIQRIAPAHRDPSAQSRDWMAVDIFRVVCPPPPACGEKADQTAPISNESNKVIGNRRGPVRPLHGAPTPGMY